MGNQLCHELVWSRHYANVIIDWLKVLWEWNDCQQACTTTNHPIQHVGPSFNTYCCVATSTSQLTRHINVSMCFIRMLISRLLLVLTFWAKGMDILLAFPSESRRCCGRNGLSLVAFTCTEMICRSVRWRSTRSCRRPVSSVRMCVWVALLSKEDKLLTEKNSMLVFATWSWSAGFAAADSPPVSPFLPVPH